MSAENCNSNLNRDDTFDVLITLGCVLHAFLWTSENQRRALAKQATTTKTN